ncbi:Lsr2 family protein [Micromonospora sp. NBC_00362]|uniref:histone-like nucleoid-structuring protein Lsr2 n=1 Tax=Micromonospora sp. NBC_00362 TaxID=2975975 RepID=UPI002254737A|nr:Lsr2 family protein [Micromonospora sp. NBC_00362]MCX5121754.1 Lsr2 family protein [Micromonospora sp. NBC_00362]
MAKQIINKLIDDISGGEADESVRFALDGVQYEIDLSSTNAGKLRNVFAPYTANGTRVGRDGTIRTRRDVHGLVGSRVSRVAKGRAAAANPDQNRAIRAWAKTAGIAVSERGRIPQQVIDEYQAKAGR